MITQNLLTTLTPTDLVLTVNRRLTMALREQYNQLQQKLGHSVWHSPDILPISSWLERCWQDCQAAGVEQPLALLTPMQEHTLWEQIISASSIGENLLRSTDTAQMAQSAWQLVQQWQINLEQSEFTQTEDTAAWYSWAQEFIRRCHTQHWLDTARLPHHITQLIKQGHIKAPARLFLLGFDEINPQYHTLLAALAEQGCHYQLIVEQYTDPVIKQLALPDTETEILSMARWCHKQLQSGITGQIACVIPNLAEIRPQVVEAFNAVLIPENKLPGYHDTTPPFNISGGLPLNHYSLIHTALVALTLGTEIPLENISLLLRTPYLAHAEQEMTARAGLDVVLRKLGEPLLLLQQAITLAKKNHCAGFTKLLENFAHLQKNLPRHLLPSLWAALFSQQLQALGWPGERTLNSTEYQLSTHWTELLSEFARLDSLLGEITISKALKQIHILAQAPFQPQSVAPAPIQILGVLEAAGLNFQQLWFMGLHDNAWPPISHPSAFIPYGLQRKLGVPHASSERELQYCRILTERLSHSAPLVILSFPQQEEDRALRPSPLIHTAKKIALADLQLPSYTAYATAVFNSASLEWYKDTQGPMINAEEKISGGSAIFKLQAACPFRAFALFRLGAESLPTQQPGLNAIEKGILLHRALELLWKKLGDQKKLLYTTPAELQTLIEQSIKDALQNFIKKRPLTFRKYFTEIEIQRLSRILHQWLEKEKSRPPFRVQALEQAQSYTIAHIPLQLRVDRIDQLADGTHLVIDYKTGNTNINAWLGERPDEPQLLLYCVANSLPIDGLLFAQLKTSDMQFKGLSADETDIPGVETLQKCSKTNPELPSDWNTLLQHWRDELEKLGQAFCDGDARVDPKNAPQTCQHCDLHLLCRVGDND